MTAEAETPGIDGLNLLSSGADFARFLLNHGLKGLEDNVRLLRYGLLHPCRRRRERMKDIDGLALRWVNVFAECCTAHDKKRFDAADFDHDELLSPILSAPVAELREFTGKLCDALQADERIPYLVWRPYCEILRKSMETMTRDRVIVLKERLAREIAEAVEDGVKPQLVEAMTNALKWRDEETLHKVKKAVERGAEPKLVGRQSCLFLEVDGELVML